MEGDEDKELLENLLKSMRKTTGMNETSFTAPKESEKASFKVKPRAKIQDGEKTSTQGPCDCGYRHHLEGEEYDYVFQVGIPGGTKLIGYNQSDNPYIVAQNFITKYRINEKSLNDTPYISALANAIMDNTKENEEKKGGGSKKEVEPSGGGFDPYKSAWNVPASGVHFNKTNNQWEGTTYTEHKKLAEAEDQKRKEMTQETKKKYQEEKLKKDIEKQRIKDQMRLDKLERDAKKKADQQKYSTPSHKVLEDGVLKVSRSAEDFQDNFWKGDRDDNEFENEEKIRDFNRTPSPFERSISPPFGTES